MDWVEGNTMPQLMTHGAGNDILCIIVSLLAFCTVDVLQSACETLSLLGLVRI